MLLSLSWLREFVPYAGTAQELGDRLTMVGLELDGIERPFEGVKDIVVGFVAECGKHPEADKLSVCRVDVGDEVLDIVCGAPNVAQGQKVAVAKIGCTLPNGLTIKKAKLRGAPSCGMICSEAELGLSDEHNGIMVLPASASAGARLADVLKLDDEVLDISITPNRGDCLSVLGLARETAAIFRLPLTLPKVALREAGADASSAVRFDVDPALCSLYHGRVLEGAAIKPSPDWMRYRLKAVGLRALNNLVDVTNYILMELGQPQHAFDLDTVSGGRIFVRGAKSGEKLVTLDGQERVLVPGDIVIADPEKAVGLGGVMGGLNSEITEKTRRIFLECAVFHPSHIRRTARRLSLHSEAAYRFERGVDQIGATYALNRAAALMAELSGATVLPGTPRVEPAPFKAPQITLRKQKAEDLLGISLTDEFCQETLESLGCGFACSSAGAATLRTGETGCLPEWLVVAPSFRPDLTREADLIEELARIYGVDRVPPTLPALARNLNRAGGDLPLHSFISRVKHWGCGAGLHEAVNYSFVGRKDLDFLGLPEQGRIGLMNPLSDELDVLRTHLAPGLLNSLRNNLSQGAQSVKLFECAGRFAASGSSETTAAETPALGILLHGLLSDRPKEAEDLGYADLRGYIEHLAESFDLPAPDFALAESAEPHFAPAVAVSMGKTLVGIAGKVKPGMADAFHAKKDVWLAELDLSALYALHIAAKPRFAPLPSFPPVRRDITFICSPGVTAGAVMDAVRALKPANLEGVALIDCFEPKGKDERNLTFRLTFRRPDRTMKDEEADKQRDTVAKALPEKLPVRV